MKSINLVLALLATLFSFSQNNFMPLDSGTVWTTQSYYINSGGAIMDGGWAKNSTDSIFNDTLINSNSYTQLFNYIGHTKEYFCGFRADTINKSIYVIPKDSTNEILFFDFDSVYTINQHIQIPVYYSGEWHLDSLKYFGENSSIIIGDTAYHNYNFESINTVYYDLLISERFINSGGLPFRPNTFFEAGTILKCYKENGIQILGNQCPYSYDYYLTIAGLNSKNAEVKVFPNPVIDNLTVECSESGFLIIYNQNGSEVLNHVVKNGFNTINLSGLQSGIYYYVLEFNQTSKAYKLIKL